MDPGATRKGVAVFNAPFSNTRSVAELDSQRLSYCCAAWRENAAAPRGMAKTRRERLRDTRQELGIIGYGNIGMQLGVIAEDWYAGTVL